MANTQSNVPTASAKELVEKAFDRLNHSGLRVPVLTNILIHSGSNGSLMVHFDIYGDVCQYKDSEGYWCILKNVYMEFSIDAFSGGVFPIDSEAHTNNIKDVNTRIELRLTYIIYKFMRAKVTNNLTQVKDKFSKYAQLVSCRVEYLED